VSFVALATDNFEAMVAFYRDRLGFRTIAAWDRDGARGMRLDLGGLKLELLDNGCQRQPIALSPAQGRIHLVVEVSDIAASRAGLDITSPEPQPTGWGAQTFQVPDPDGIAVTFLQWNDQPS
jgi:catechol 2,3-dioxygenase-like lactoylglutathione lyase family enzyme